MSFRWPRSFYCIIIGTIMLSLMGGIFLGSGLSAFWGSGMSHSLPSSPPIDLSNALKVDKLIPLAIVGSGPAGQAAALYGARGGVFTVVFEGNSPGGLLMQTNDVENWPGEALISGADLIKKMRTQVEKMGAVFVRDAVAQIDTKTWPYQITMESGDIFYCMSLILALGSSPQKLNVPGEETYWGAGVTACAICDGSFFKGKKVVVVGGGDAAVGEAIVLANYASEITMLVRKSQMRAAATVQKRLEAFPNIHVRYNVAVKSIDGDGKKVTGVTLSSSKEDVAEEKMPIDGVFLAVGHLPNTEFVKNTVACNKEGYIKVHGRSQQTSVEGIFAAGDVEDYVYRQAIVASGDGVKASLDAQRFLTSIGYNAQFFHDHSDIFYRPTAGDDAESELYQPITAAYSLEELEDLYAQMPNKIIILDFGASHCVLCKKIEPLLDEVATMYHEKVHLVKIDGDKADPDLLEKWSIGGFPTLVFMYDHTFKIKHIGDISKKMILSIVDGIIKETEK